MPITGNTATNVATYTMNNTTDRYGMILTAVVASVYQATSVDVALRKASFTVGFHDGAMTPESFGTATTITDGAASSTPAETHV